MQSWWPPLLPMNFLTGKPYMCCYNSLCSNHSYVHTHTCRACALFFVWTPHLAGFCTAGDPRKCRDEYEVVWKKGSRGIKGDSCWQCQGWGDSSSSWPGACIDGCSWSKHEFPRIHSAAKKPTQQYNCYTQTHEVRRALLGWQREQAPISISTQAWYIRIIFTQNVTVSRSHS